MFTDISKTGMTTTWPPLSVYKTFVCCSLSLKHDQCNGIIDGDRACECTCHGDVVRTECGHVFPLPASWGREGRIASCLVCAATLIVAPSTTGRMLGNLVRA